jgi:hypothetical protein
MNNEAIILHFTSALQFTIKPLRSGNNDIVRHAALAIETQNSILKLRDK